MAALFTMTEDDIIRGLRERGLPLDSPDDLTQDERALVQEYAGLVFSTATRELLDMLALAIRRSRGLPE